MPPRIKKLIAIAILLPSLVVYFLAAAALGGMVPNHQLLKVPYFLVAGLAWAFPTQKLINWANADPPVAPLPRSPE